MLLSELLGVQVVTTDGDELGHVHDVVLVQDGPMGANGRAGLRLHALAVGSRSLGSQLGYSPGDGRGTVAVASAPPPASPPRPLVRDRATRRAPHRRRPIPPRTRSGLMSRNQITVTASPEAVFEVLDDADAYPRWVVGARRLRRVDADWPHEGSEFHHAIGVAGAELHDSTEVLEHEPLHRIVLEVRFRPTGTARVELTVDATDDGTVVTMEETPGLGSGELAAAVRHRSRVARAERVVVATLAARGRAAGPIRLLNHVASSTAAPS